MRIISYNVNGIRAALRKGVFAWLASFDPDILCLQEVKAQAFALPSDAGVFCKYHTAYADAQRPGYSGVAMFAKRAPDHIVHGLGDAQFDAEGRAVEMTFGDLRVVSLYVPSGTTGAARQAVKDRFMEYFEMRLGGLRDDGYRYVIAGDFNVAHREIDIHDPKRCAAFSGFLPHERRWMDRLIDEQGWVDAFRVIDAEPARYTWWTYRAGAFERNKGWRIDYQLASPALRATVRTAHIATEHRYSDHAPLIVDYDLVLANGPHA